jgi:hypothetical protein
LNDDRVRQDTLRPKAVTCWDVADPLEVANTKIEVADTEKERKVQCVKQSDAPIRKETVVVINEDGLALGHG